MKVLLFCNDIQSAQIAFELIRLRHFAGIVVPCGKNELIDSISHSGYIQEDLLFTPDPDNDKELVEIINKIEPDLGLVATFPRIFPKAIFTLPRLGFYNIHYGMLPNYRSANPVFWQIRNGEKSGGVSIFKIDETIDGGAIVMAEQFPIEIYDNYAVVLSKSVDLACRMVEPFMQKIKSGALNPVSQDQADAKYYSKPGIDDVRIDWKNMTMNEIVATVNAGNPWNRGAITTLDENEVRLVQVSPAQYPNDLPDAPGKIALANVQHGVFVICKNQELLRVDTVYTKLGYHSGGLMLCTGIQEGKVFY